MQPSDEDEALKVFSDYLFEERGAIVVDEKEEKHNKEDTREATKIRGSKKANQNFATEEIRAAASKPRLG
eukprot:12071314-Heterocapsa_arctica.AAC.1